MSKADALTQLIVAVTSYLLRPTEPIEHLVPPGSRPRPMEWDEVEEANDTDLQDED